MDAWMDTFDDRKGVITVMVNGWMDEWMRPNCDINNRTFYGATTYDTRHSTIVAFGGSV